MDLSSPNLFYLQHIYSSSNFPVLSSNIPSSTAYDVIISQYVRYAKTCSKYDEFIRGARRLASKLNVPKYAISSLRKFVGDSGDLMEICKVTRLTSNDQRHSCLRLNG